MELSIQLAEIFLGNPGGVYSIHQISKKLEIPYGTAYNRIHDLGKRGIVNIMPQGKAKLCALNPANPMTSTLLGLGAAKTTTQYLQAKAPYSTLLAKLRDLLDATYQDSLHSAILLNPDVLQELYSPSSKDAGKSSANPGEIVIDGSKVGEAEISLDLFLVMDEEEVDTTLLESALHAAIPQHQNVRVTRMVVTPSTLMGMLQEKENEAGLAAYHMLRRGIILEGFDKFFRLILKSFANLHLRA